MSDRSAAAESPSYEAALKFRITQSFTKQHGRLLDLCLAVTARSPRLHPKPAPLPHLSPDVLTLPDLDTLQKMVEQEFVASFQQELQNQNDDSENNEPRVFDVYLMKSTLDRASQHGRRPIALCVPDRKRLRWWNGLGMEDGEQRGMLWDLVPPSHVRRLTNLAGSARILKALSTARSILAPPNDGVDKSLVEWAMKRQGIFVIPQAESAPLMPCEESSSSFSALLNPSQQAAVNAVANHFTQGFLCIQGPPGTGKTTTMVEMIRAAIAKYGGGVVVTAPSNAAVANIALKLYSTGTVPFGKMVIFGENCHGSVKFLQPKFRSQEFITFLERYESILTIKPSDKQKQRAAKLLHDFVAWLQLSPRDDGWSLKELSHQCPVIYMDEKGLPTSGGKKAFSRICSNSAVVFCTLNSAGSFTLRKALEDGQFTTLMLDEGGQCTEAEFFIATTFPGIQRIVIMGDPKQLRPTVIDQRCEAAGFGNSFLGQVYKNDPKQLHLLDTQYRMDPLILEFPNDRFYSNRIQCGDNVRQREPQVDRPFLLVDTVGRGHETQIQRSWQNPYEAIVINIVLKSDPDIRKLLSTEAGSIKVIVITPYKSQLKLLQQQIKLAKHSKNVELLISTVDAFQGQEADIVLVSTVRTKNVGFVDDPSRLNVALTRAKRVLRVVGDMKFFESIPSNQSTLKALARHAMTAGLVDVDQLEPSITKEKTAKETNAALEGNNLPSSSGGNKKKKTRRRKKNISSNTGQTK